LFKIWTPFDKVKFDFCKLWDGFTKVAIFFQQKGEFSYSLINADGTCDIPNSILKLTGKIFICASGTSPNKEVRTTNILSYTINEGIAEVSLMDEFPDEISEEEKNDVYNKMLELSQNIQVIYLDLVRNMGYLKFKDVNEFEYDVELFEDRVNKVVEPIRTTLEETIVSLNKHRQDISTNTANINSNRRYLENECGDLKSSVNELESLLAELTYTHERDTDRLQSELQSVLQSFEHNLQNINSKISELESRLS